MADSGPGPAAGASAAGADGLAQLSNLMGAEGGPGPAGGDRDKIDVKAMPVRQYLESKVVPVLLQGMQRLVVERPVDPIDFLSKFLHDNNPNKKPVEEKRMEQAS